MQKPIYTRNSLAIALVDLIDSIGLGTIQYVTVTPSGTSITSIYISYTCFIYRKKVLASDCAKVKSVRIIDLPLPTHPRELLLGWSELAG